MADEKGTVVEHWKKVTGDFLHRCLSFVVIKFNQFKRDVMCSDVEVSVGM
jgi:hypothetical protein